MGLLQEAATLVQHYLQGGHCAPDLVAKRHAEYHPCLETMAIIQDMLAEQEQILRLGRSKAPTLDRKESTLNFTFELWNEKYPDGQILGMEQLSFPSHDLWEKSTRKGLYQWPWVVPPHDPPLFERTLYLGLEANGHLRFVKIPLSLLPWQSPREIVKVIGVVIRALKNGPKQIDQLLETTLSILELDDERLSSQVPPTFMPREAVKKEVRAIAKALPSSLRQLRHTKLAEYRAVERVRLRVDGPWRCLTPETLPDQRQWTICLTPQTEVAEILTHLVIVALKTSEPPFPVAPDDADTAMTWIRRVMRSALRHWGKDEELRKALVETHIWDIRQRLIDDFDLPSSFWSLGKFITNVVRGRVKEAWRKQMQENYAQSGYASKPKRSLSVDERKEAGNGPEEARDEPENAVDKPEDYGIVVKPIGPVEMIDPVTGEPCGPGYSPDWIELEWKIPRSTVYRWMENHHYNIDTHGNRVLSEEELAELIRARELKGLRRALKRLGVKPNTAAKRVRRWSKEGLSIDEMRDKVKRERQDRPADGISDDQDEDSD